MSGQNKESPPPRYIRYCCNYTILNSYLQPEQLVIPGLVRNVLELHLVSKSLEPTVPITLGGRGQSQSQLVAVQQILDVAELLNFSRTKAFLRVLLNFPVSQRLVCLCLI